MESKRKNELLNHIIEDYIKTAQAVGSNYLVKKFKLGLSSATVRNIMAELESEGLLISLHTSSGRIPTEKAYQFFLNAKCKMQNAKLRKNSIIKRESQELKKAYKIKNNDSRTKQKNLAKSLAELSQSAVLVGFDKLDVYYTGLSYLFSQPEFSNLNLVYNISEVVDHLDEVFSEVHDKLDENILVKIGSENPFSSECSFIGIKLAKLNSAFGILGPMRMEYMKNIERLEYVRQLLAG